MSRERSQPDDESPPPIRFTLRSALLLNTLLGIVPLISLGFTLAAGILVGLCLLQLPLFVLFGAFRLEAASTKE